jgi:thiamine biosynthesis lipoprotein
MRFFHFLALTSSIAGLIIFFVFFNSVSLVKFEGLTMGTSYSVTISGNFSKSEIAPVEDKVAEILHRLDRELFSSYAFNSEVAQFNRMTVGVPLVVSPEQIEVLSLSQKVFTETDGAFDITVGPLVRLWGFGPEPRMKDFIPTSSEIALSMARLGMESLVIDPSLRLISKTKNIELDVSGIAKGYAVDKVSDLLVDYGYENHFVEIGGELKMRGYKAGKISWAPALETPVNSKSEVYAALDSLGHTIAIAGSGDYRNFFEKNGVRYSHEIDPRNGRPVSHSLAAVYVINETASVADALATAYLVMGLEAAIEHASANNTASYFISHDVAENKFYQTHTPQFAKYLVN